MKVIDLLNKIANGEDIPRKIKYNNTDYYFYDSYTYLRTDKARFFDSIYFKELNDEVEIIEEEKKIPEKLPYYSLEKIQKAKNKDEWREERITLLEKRIDDLHIKMNELIDYLKSKGE